LINVTERTQRQWEGISERIVRGQKALIQQTPGRDEGIEVKDDENGTRTSGGKQSANG